MASKQTGQWGDQRKRENEINDFVKEEETEETKGNDLKNNVTWIHQAKKQEEWKKKEEEFAKQNSQRKAAAARVLGFDEFVRNRGSGVRITSFSVLEGGRVDVYTRARFCVLCHFGTKAFASVHLKEFCAPAASHVGVDWVRISLRWAGG